ncbi:MAG: hypothetical protein HY747_12375 [Elusimicrobia bacterium]|nr:hypothetical protein [Elusimicrobiota bacterium]
MKHFFIEGTPGVGKTTLIREAVLPYGPLAGGFVTLEVRGKAGERLGFEVLRLQDGKRGLFASKEMASSVRLGKYGLDMAVFEELGVKAIEQARENPGVKLIVVDEIGAMEAESAAFRSLMLECLKDEAKPMLASIRAKSRPFIADVKKLPDVRLTQLTRANYPAVKAELKKWLAGIFNF